MTIYSLDIEGYRSIQKLTLEFGAINIITGANGSGKSNLYRAIYILAQAAHGQLARNLADEGGIPSLMWAGERRLANFNDKSVRLNLSIVTDSFSYSLSCGVPPNKPPSMFALDPEVKEEYIWHGATRRPSTTILERKNNSVFAYDSSGERMVYPFCIAASESILAQLQEPQRYPELAILSMELKQWRFYHNFRTDERSLIRLPQVSVRTPVLSNDGQDLAAAIQTIIEVGDEKLLERLIDRAFPGARLSIVDPHSKARFEIQFSLPRLLRPLSASELSDGTLRYLCLLAALLSPRPPKVMVLNEPEMSLHADLLVPLAELIQLAAESSQIIITTHSEILVQAIKNLTAVRPIHLTMGQHGTQVIDGY
jgi:predicted ATPase